MKLLDDLLYIKDGTSVHASPYARTILEFKDLKNSELAFIYFMIDHRSPYAVYEWEQRIEEVKETSAVRLLKAARESIVKLEKYFRFVDLHAMDDRGKPIYSAKDLINNLEKMGKVVDGLTRLEDIVKREEQAANLNRGGVETNKYSV